MTLDAAAASGISHPWPDPPAQGEATEVAPRIHWVRLPLPMTLDHVNIYVLDEGESWTLIDTGLNWKGCRAAWEALEAGALAAKPVRRVILTHHHPDHIGLVGHFAAEGAEVWATRVAWLFGRMLTLDRHDLPTERHLTFRRRAGMPEDMLAAYAAEKPFNFADCVAPIPLGFRAIDEGDEISAGGRRWTIRLGHGHAPHHATLWSEDGIVLAGDQIIPGISSNVSVYPTEPDADPLGDWLESCRRLCEAATGDELVLPGHKLPFQGVQFRLTQLIDNHVEALARIEVAMGDSPITAADTFAAVFKRRIGPAEYGLALGEAVAHLNHLLHQGRATRDLAPDGSWRFSRPG